MEGCGRKKEAFARPMKKIMFVFKIGLKEAQMKITNTVKRRKPKVRNPNNAESLTIDRSNRSSSDLRYSDISNVRSSALYSSRLKSECSVWRTERLKSLGSFRLVRLIVQFD